MEKIEKEKIDETYIDVLYKSRDIQLSQFHKYIITISSGALILSLTFIKDIINKKMECSMILILSWGLFILVILLSLIYTKVNIAQIDYTLENYPDDNKILRIITNTISIANIILIILGLIIFISINL